MGDADQHPALDTDAAEALFRSAQARRANLWIRTRAIEPPWHDWLIIEEPDPCAGRYDLGPGGWWPVGERVFKGQAA